MKTVEMKYTVALEGNDIETKKVQKLKSGAPLLLKRITDAEDTYEICLCHSDGKEIDMLSYSESIGIAPYMDGGLLSAAACVDNVEVKPGKTRAKDITLLTAKAVYEYDEETLELYTGRQASGFTCADDRVLSMAVAAVTDGDTDILVQRPYINLYTMEFDTEDGRVCCNALFNEEFTKCKITAKIYNEQNETALELDENEKETVLTLVNHARIFEGEDGLNCEME